MAINTEENGFINRDKEVVNQNQTVFVNTVENTEKEGLRISRLR